MTGSQPLPPKTQAELDRVAATLMKSLGANLHSLLLYGSAVRGNHVPELSDLNLLILLEESTPEAHAAIAEAIRGSVRIEPFILSRALLARSFQAFATKFLSIRRNYRVLHGSDPLAGLSVDESLARFLCEQAVRNLRLRCVRSFVVFNRDAARYARFLSKHTPAVFTGLSEAIRRTGQDVPSPYEERIPVFEKTFDADASVLRRMLELKSSQAKIPADVAPQVHPALFRLLDAAVRWMEAQWPPLR